MYDKMSNKIEVAKQDGLQNAFRASDNVLEPLAGGIAYVSTAVAVGTAFLSAYFPSPTLTELLRDSVETAVASGASKFGLSILSGKLSERLHVWKENAGDRLTAFTGRISTSALIPSAIANGLSGTVGVIAAVGSMVDPKFVPLAWESLKVWLISAGATIGTYVVKKVAEKQD
jgi:hypothetical protein